MSERQAGVGNIIAILMIIVAVISSFTVTTTRVESLKDDVCMLKEESHILDEIQFNLKALMSSQGVIYTEIRREK